MVKNCIIKMQYENIDLKLQFSSYHSTLILNICNKNDENFKCQKLFSFEKKDKGWNGFLESFNIKTSQ